MAKKFAKVLFGKNFYKRLQNLGLKYLEILQK